MMLRVCAVFDQKTGQYSNVSLVNETVDAVRQFEIACKSKDSILSFYPDFTLVHIADFDTEFGSFFNLDDFETLARSGGDHVG